MKTTPQLGGSLCRPSFCPWKCHHGVTGRGGSGWKCWQAHFHFTAKRGMEERSLGPPPRLPRTWGAGARSLPRLSAPLSALCRAHRAGPFSPEARQPGRAPLLPAVAVPSASPASRRPRRRSRPLSFCLAGKELFLASASVIWHLNVTRALVANIYSSKILKFQSL